MKVIVYAISKNESKFVERWCKSMSEADEIYVLDTGSTDDTVELLRNNGVNVLVEEIIPWRFDIARNKSLDMVPDDTDICVCTDLDEVFVPGWRNELEKVWKVGTNRLRYIYNWSLDEDDIPKISFYGEKIHSRHGYKWTHPVHEVLSFDLENENFLTTDNIIINHYPDSNKSRGSYLGLLELSVKESPNDDRNMHYLGREYMYYSRWNDCIDTLIKHLNLKTSTWRDERCASMRFIARCYTNLKRYDEARMWLDKAMNEAPYLRDPFVERALLEYRLENWDNVEKYCFDALKIVSHPKTYINEVFSWDYTVFDLLSLSYFYEQDYEKALEQVDIAIKMNTNEVNVERLLNNKKII